MPDIAPVSERVSTIEDLTRFFPSAARPRPDWLLGVEHEKMPVGPDGGPIPYDGPGGIVALLQALQGRGFVLTYDGKSVIGAGRTGEEITLEPGLQVELSAPPLPTALACRDLLRRHLDELRALSAPLGIRFISGGFRPFGRSGPIPWLPKRRYDIMRELPAHRGAAGARDDEAHRHRAGEPGLRRRADAADKIRAASGVTSIVTALFAASPITEGRPNGYKSYRAAVWLDMDEARCGLLPFVFEPGFGLRAMSIGPWTCRCSSLRGAGNTPPAGAHLPALHARGVPGRTAPPWTTGRCTCRPCSPRCVSSGTIELRGADAGADALRRGAGGAVARAAGRHRARAAAWALVASTQLRRTRRRCGGGARGRACGRAGRAQCWRAGGRAVRHRRRGLARLPGGDERSGAARRRWPRPPRRALSPPTTCWPTSQRPGAIPRGSSTSGSCASGTIADRQDLETAGSDGGAARI